MQSPKTRGFKDFTDKEWAVAREHTEEKGFAKCKCPLCKSMRAAIQVEVHKPLPKRDKENKVRDEARYKQWKELPIEAFRAFDEHPAKCECDLCMKIKNFFGRDKELEEIASKWEEDDKCQKNQGGQKQETL